MRAGTLRLARIAAVAGLCVALVGCKSSPRERAGLLAKPVGALERANLEHVCADLGWTNEGVTSATHGAFSQVAARCSRESPDGVEGPDHKKRTYLTVAIYNEPPSGLDRVTKRVESEQGAFRVEGGQLLAASLLPPSQPQAQAMLERLIGK